MFKREPITSFSEITLRVSGMRLTQKYEVICRGDETEISLYWLSFAGGEDTYELQKRVTAPTADVIGLLDRCGVNRWDGFSGKNPPGVRDGVMFSFKAAVNGGKNISADGSNNFPKHYREFTDTLDRMLRE